MDVFILYGQKCFLPIAKATIKRVWILTSDWMKLSRSHTIHGIQRWCCTRRFTTTIFSSTKRCNIVATLFQIVTTLKWRNDRRSERNLCNCVKKPEKKNHLSSAPFGVLKILAYHSAVGKSQKLLPCNYSYLLYSKLKTLIQKN